MKTIAIKIALTTAVTGASVVGAYNWASAERRRKTSYRTTHAPSRG